MPYDSFNGITQFGEAALSQPLEYSIQFFLNWSYLKIGAFNNVTMNLLGPYGGQNYTLRPVNAQGYAPNTVWQGFRSNWVWETGVPYTYQPINISGIYFGGQFLPVETAGQMAYSIDYENGRVLFDNAQPATGLLQLEYSYRNVNVTTADEPWFKELLYTSYRSDQINYISSSGLYLSNGIDRVQMPAIVMEMVPIGRSAGYALGGGHWKYRDVLFHVFAETRYDRDNIIDQLDFLCDSTIFVLNINTMVASGVFPLSANGSRAENCQNYPFYLQNPYVMARSTFIDVNIQEMGAISQRLFGGIVRATMETAVGWA